MQNIESDLKHQGFPPIAWYDVLWELEKAPEGCLPQIEAQRRSILAQYNFVRLLDRLERAELIKRRPCTADGRSNILQITASGKSLRRAMCPAYDAAMHFHIGRHLTNADAAQLAELLAKLIPQVSMTNVQEPEIGLPLDSLAAGPAV